MTVHHQVHNNPPIASVLSQINWLHAHLPYHSFYYYPPICAFAFQFVSFLQVSPPKFFIFLSFPLWMLKCPARLNILLVVTLNIVWWPVTVTDWSRRAANGMWLYTALNAVIPSAYALKLLFFIGYSKFLWGFRLTDRQTILCLYATVSQVQVG